MDNIDTVITNGKDSINTLEEENQFDLNFVNEERTMHCSSVVYCAATSRTLIYALIYSRGTAGALQILGNLHIQVTHMA